MTNVSLRHTMNHIDLSLFKSSHRRCSVEKGVLKNFANFTGKHLCSSLFLIKTFLPKKKPFCRRDNAACRRELERLYIYSIYI